MSRPPILLLHGMFSTPMLLSDWVSTLESAGYRVHTPVYPGHDPVDMGVLIAGFVPDSAHVFRSMSMGSRDTRVDPRAVRCPVLCVSGGADRNVATWISRRIARRYSAQEHHHPDLPHWIVANSALPQVAPPVLGWLEARVTESARRQAAKEN